MKKSAKIALGAVLCAAAAAAGAYFGDAVYFDGRFPYRTSLNGVDISCMTADEARAALEASYADYHLEVRGRDGLTEDILGSEVGLVPVPDRSFEEMVGGTDPYTWPVSLFRSTELTAQIEGSYDEGSLSQRVRSLAVLSPENVRLPKDAGVVYEDGRYVVREDDGALPDGVKIRSLVTDALKGFGGTVDLEDAGVYRLPEVTEDDPVLQREAEAMNAYAGTVIDLPVGGDSEKIDGSVYQSWFAVDDDGRIVIGEDGRASLDHDRIAEYVDRLAEQYDTYMKPHDFITTGGEKITIENANYGWQIDRRSTASLLAEAVDNGESGEIEPVYLHTARSHGEKDYGDSYVEIDLDAQRVYVYVDGEIAVETDCVSGKAIGGAATPPGMFSVFSMMRNAVLRGEGYASPVSYWMPFNRNIGLHDANWRGRFGGDLYVNGGSHGCVNLPVSVAGQVYANVQNGTPVIVYGGLDREGAAAYNRAKANGEVQSVYEFIRGKEAAEKAEEQKAERLAAREAAEKEKAEREQAEKEKAEKEALARAEKEEADKAGESTAAAQPEKTQAAPAGTAAPAAPAVRPAPAAPQQPPAVAAALAQANAAQAAYDQAQATLGAAQAAAAAAPGDAAIQAVVEAARSQADQAKQTLDAANLAAYEAALAAGQ